MSDYLRCLVNLLHVCEQAVAPWAFAGLIYHKYHYLVHRSILIIVLNNLLYEIYVCSFVEGPKEDW